MLQLPHRCLTTTAPGNSGARVTTAIGSQSGNGWNFGGKVMAGLDFGSTYLEASYQISGSQVGVRSDSANLSLGLHF